MIPTKVKDLIPLAAAHIGIPEEHLANILSFYYKGIKVHLSQLDHNHITLRGLGMMNIKGWEIEKRTFEFHQTIAASTNRENIEELEKQIALYRKSNERWLDEQAQKQRVKELKKQYYANKNANDEFEGQVTDGLEE